MRDFCRVCARARLETALVFFLDAFLQRPDDRVEETPAVVARLDEKPSNWHATTCHLTTSPHSLSNRRSRVLRSLIWKGKHARMISRSLLLCLVNRVPAFFLSPHTKTLLDLTRLHLFHSTLGTHPAGLLPLHPLRYTNQRPPLFCQTVSTCSTLSACTKILAASHTRHRQ